VSSATRANALYPDQNLKLELYLLSANQLPHIQVFMQASSGVEGRKEECLSYDRPTSIKGRVRLGQIYGQFGSSTIGKTIKVSNT
jgi:hypothetical protein